MKKLIEGLFKDDLENMVSPLIVIDEFESKIDEDGIVVAFFCDEEEAANDLSYFIEHSYVELLDTEVSPAPNEDGKYLVFVEMERDSAFIKHLLEIISILKGPIGKLPWKFKVYKDPTDYELTEENLAAHVRTVPKDQHVQENVEQELYDFFRTSLLDDVKIKGNKIIFEKKHEPKRKFILEGFYDYNEIEEYLKDKTIQLDESSVSKCRKLEKYLGYSWTAHKVNENFVLSSDDNNLYLVVKPA